MGQLERAKGDTYCVEGIMASLSELEWAIIVLGILQQA